MQERFYPPLDEKSIKIIQKLYEADPEYFSDDRCPYQDSTKALFTGTSAVFDFASHTSERSEPVTDEDILNEINDLHAKLKEYWDDVKDSEKAGDKNTFFRVSVSLLERIVDLKTKASTLSNMNSFIQEVMNCMQEILTVDQRNEVIARLERFQKGQS